MILRFKPLFLATLSFVMPMTACDSSKSGGREGAKEPAQVPSTNGSNGGSSGNSSSSIVFDSPSVLASKIEVKGYHMLVKDGEDGFSGYCVANVEKPNLPDAALEGVELSPGPCPQTLKVQNSQASMAYVCEAKVGMDGKKYQTVLYSKINTTEGMKDIKTVGPQIIDGFCST